MTRLLLLNKLLDNLGKMLKNIRMLSDMLKKKSDAIKSSFDTPQPKSSFSDEISASSTKQPETKQFSTNKFGGNTNVNTTYFSEDVEFKGTLSFSNKFELHGRFEGDIHAENDLLIGTSAVVKANIEGTHIIIHGKVQGNITASEKIELLDSAVLLGDIKAPKFIISEGATFVGKSETLDNRSAGGNFDKIFSRLGKDPKEKSVSGKSSSSTTSTSSGSLV
jgi:cytoskeletal protein CcmA (bactofilin family)